MQTLSIVGCGQVGSVLGALFHTTGLLRIESLMDRDWARASKLAQRLEAGTPLRCIDSLAHSDLLLLAVPDSALQPCVQQLQSQRLVKSGALVFHCSGAVPAEVLAPLRTLGSLVASLHPVRSFADFERSCESFAGTYCGLEGDPEACSTLSALFSALGAQVFAIDPAHKEIYHAGAVFACNHLVALLEMSLRAYEQSGVPRETALKVLEPLLRGTISNVFSSGLGNALSGPIVRADGEAITRQLAAVDAWDSRAAELYRLLSGVLVEVLAANNRLAPDTVNALEHLLQRRAS